MANLWINENIDSETCAVDGCDAPAKPQFCFYDDQHHHHGCIHYNCGHPAHSVTFRPGWHRICDYHYLLLKAERQLWERGRRA